MKKLICLVMGLLALPIMSCSGNGKGTDEPNQTPVPQVPEKEYTGEIPEKFPDDFQGKWYDISSNATLEFNGTKMTLSMGSWEEVFETKAEKTEYSFTVDSKDGAGFGFLSSLTVDSKGRLTASEMILDGPSNTYKFVRQEALAQEREIQDLSTDLPKEIESDEIESFSFYFKLSQNRRYGLDSEVWPNARITWEIEKGNFNSYMCEYVEMFDSSVGRRYDDKVSKDFVKKLAQIIKDHNIAQYNGYFKKNSVDKEGYSLYVTYESGEEIVIRAEGDAADGMVFDPKPLMDHLLSIVDENFYK